jgi:hypothetical protein
MRQTLGVRSQGGYGYCARFLVIGALAWCAGAAAGGHRLSRAAPLAGYCGERRGERRAQQKTMMGSAHPASRSGIEKLRRRWRERRARKRQSAPVPDPLPERWPLELWAQETPWPLERVAATAGVLIEREMQWIQRRTERFEFLDGRRVRKTTHLELTVPRVTTDTDDERLPLPIAQPVKRPLGGLQLIDESGKNLPHLTRDENRLVAATLLRQQAQETLGQRATVPAGVVGDLCDVVGLRRSPEDYPDPVETARRCEAGLQRFRSDHRAQSRRNVGAPALAGEALHEERMARVRLWDDGSTRTWMQLLARRFLLFVPDLGPPGAHKTITLGYEGETDTREEELTRATQRPLPAQLWRAVTRTLLGRTIEYHFNIPTRGPYAAASYHAELLAPEDLTVMDARLRLTTRAIGPGSEPTVTTDIASDSGTSLVHVYTPGRRPSRRAGGAKGASVETEEACLLRVGLCVRAGMVLPVVMTAAIDFFAFSLGILARALGHKAESATVAVVLVALPAVYAAHLLPQGHPLVRRFFKDFRAILVILTLLPFAAAASVAIDFATTLRYVVWSVSVLVAVACLVSATLALRRAWVGS